jgi:hypothetical protein
MARPVARPPTDARAAAHFTTLNIALERGDYAAAAKAQQALAELGWDIRRNRPQVAPEEERGVAR